MVAKRLMPRSYGTAYSNSALEQFKVWDTLYGLSVWRRETAPVPARDVTPADSICEALTDRPTDQCLAFLAFLAMVLVTTHSGYNCDSSSDNVQVSSTTGFSQQHRTYVYLSICNTILEKQVYTLNRYLSTIRTVISPVTYFDFKHILCNANDWYSVSPMHSTNTPLCRFVSTDW